MPPVRLVRGEAFFEGAQLIRPSCVPLRHIEQVVTGERSDGLDGDACF